MNAKPSVLPAVSAAFLFLFTAVARAEIAARPQDIRPLLIGASVPPVLLQSPEGEKNLRELIQGKPTVLVFYRGSWCPYCTYHLVEMMDSEPPLLALGYQILAISPDAPVHSEQLKKEKKMPYTLLSDPRLSAAEAFGLAFRLDEATLEKYRGYGIDLSKSSGGTNRDVLPVPAVFIIDAEGRIAFHFVDPDYRYRVSGELVLTAARVSLEFHQKAKR